MKKTTVVSLLISSALLVLCGCASDKGSQADTATTQPAKTEKPKDKRPIEQRLAVGMSKDDVRAALGNPAGTAVDSSGNETWTYSDHAKAFIPYYTLTGGKFHNVVVSFDKDGKVKSWSSNTSSAY